MSVTKIHVNSSTKLSLNDRFTIMQNINPVSPSAASSGAAGGPPRNINRGSNRSRQLLNRLEQKHKINASMKLKKKSIRRNLMPRRLNSGKALSISPAGRIRRTNSLINLAT